MVSWKQKVFTALWVAAFFISQIVISPLYAQSTGTSRISGDDRYKTAAAVSQKGWKTADYAVLARGDDFADALCAGPLASKYAGPILLTPPNQLHPETLKELKRLGVKHLFIAGGLGAVSQTVENELKANGIPTIERIFGDNRYETAVKIAEKVGLSNKAVLAAGSDFPDALSISAVASNLGMPILLTPKDRLPDVAKAYLTEKGITQTYVIGGTGVISTGVENSVPGPLRIAGTDRYDTNIQVLKNFESSLNFENIYVAIGRGILGNEFADALAGAVLAAKTASPLVLTSQSLPSVTGNYLKSKVLLISKVTGLGGQTVVPSTVLTKILAYKEEIPVARKYSTAGTYGPANGTETVSGSVTISAADVTLQNTIIQGDLLLAHSIGDGNVYLKDVTVKGKTIVNGGGPNSVIMYNFNGTTVVIDVPEGSSVRLVAQGNTTVTDVSVQGNGTLQETDLTGSGFINVAIPAGAQVTLSGDFQQVNVEGNGANVTVTSGNITTLSIPENAVGAQVNLSSSASVSTLNANAPVSITGQGKITTANVASSGVTIEQTPAQTTIAPGTTANVGGQQQTGTSTPPSSGGGGGSGGDDNGGDSSSVSVSALTGADILLRPGSIIMGYTFEGSAGTITYSEAISDTYGLDLVNSTVTLAVQVGESYTVLGNVVHLNSLTIEDSSVRGESAKVTFTDFDAFLDVFGLDFSNPANVPTHVKVVVKSKTSIGDHTVSNPWGPIDSGWVAIDNNLIAIDPANSTGSIGAGNKTAGTPFPISITLKDPADQTLENGTYGVEISTGESLIGGGQIEFTDGQATVNALIAAEGVHSLTIKVNLVTIETINNVTVVSSPILESGEISPDDDTVSLTFSKAMTELSADQYDQFTITVNGAETSITQVTTSNNTIVFTIDSDLVGGEAITIAYTQGDVTSADGGILRTFIPFAIGSSNDTAVTSKNSGMTPHYAVTVHGSSLIPADNPIAEAVTPITINTEVGAFLSNLDFPEGSLYKVANASTIPGPFETWNFGTIGGKDVAQMLAQDDLLLVLAQDGTTLRGYYIQVVNLDE